MSIRAMTIVFASRLEGRAKLCALALADWCNDDGLSLHPSVKAVAEKISASERTAQRVLRELMEEGFLEVVGNANGGAPGTCRHYQLRLDRFTTGDKPGETGDKTGIDGCQTVQGRVTKQVETGDTGDTQSVNEPSMNHQGTTPLPPAPVPVAVVASGFEHFWAAYPNTGRKVAKGKCEEVWRKRRLDLLTDHIVAHVLAMKQTEQWQRFEPAPKTYLNESRWEDPVPEAGPHNEKRAYFKGFLEDGTRDQAAIGGDVGELRPVLQGQVGGLLSFGDGEVVDEELRERRD